MTDNIRYRNKVSSIQRGLVVNFSMQIAKEITLFQRSFYLPTLSFGVNNTLTKQAFWLHGATLKLLMAINVLLVQILCNCHSFLPEYHIAYSTCHCSAVSNVIKNKFCRLKVLTIDCQIVSSASHQMLFYGIVL